MRNRYEEEVKKAIASKSGIAAAVAARLDIEAFRSHSETDLKN